MNMKLIANKIIPYLFSFIILFFLLPQTTLAYRVIHKHPTGFNSLPRHTNFISSGKFEWSYSAGTEGDKEVGEFILYQIYSQDFNMIRSDNNSNLIQSGDSIPSGTNLQYISKFPTEGLFFYGRDSAQVWPYLLCISDIAPLDGKVYIMGSGISDCSYRPSSYLSIIRNNREYEFGSPLGGSLKNNPPSSIIGQGAVTCKDSTCSTTGVGPASITITFDVKEPLMRSSLPFLSSFGGGNANYKSKFTYNFNVYNLNNAPTVNCQSPFNISSTSADARWSYNDADGDIQTQAQVQVSTDMNFNNISANVIVYGSETKITIGDGSNNNPYLNSGTPYYTRIRVKNSVNDWTGFSICTNSFLTLSNNPATVELSSVSSASTAPLKYTTAVIYWTYKDPENDIQIKADIQISKDQSFSTDTTTYVSNGPGTMYTQGSLLSGGTYYVRVRAENIPNRWSEWSPSLSLNIPNYPEPNVVFKLNKQGDLDIKSKTNGQTLEVKAGDTVNLIWEVKDPDGTTPPSGLKSCNITVTDDDERNIFNNTEYSGNISISTTPNKQTDYKYQFKLTCIGNKAQIDRSIDDKIITLKVIIYPVVSCSIDGGRKSVSAVNPNISITATLNGNYDWEAGVNTNNEEQNRKSGTATANTQQIELDYKGVDFGRYQPWIKIIPTSGTPVKAICETITNFGSSQIREVNP